MNDRFRHDRNPYHRPTNGYRCGRGAMWDKPCAHGPETNGSCTGGSACQPARKGDRWECRRAKQLGGPCEQGPSQDGQCAHQLPPCIPRPSLRRWRGRLNAIAVILALAVIVAFTDPMAILGDDTPASDPGMLASVHSGFIGAEGCGACHAGHGQGVGHWLSSAFSSDDMTEQCATCHVFGGPAEAAHNQIFPERDDLAMPACIGCHTEHRGMDSDPAEVPEFVCENCHRETVHGFNDDHPEFGDGYPHEIPDSLYFDHRSHLGKYFSDPDWINKPGRDPEFARLAAEDCGQCHLVDEAGRDVAPRPFGVICAGCHQEQVMQAQFNLMLPDEVTYVGGMLLGMDPDEADEDELFERVAELYGEMTDSGVDALVALVEDEAGIEERSEDLFDGLAPGLVNQVGESWQEEDEVEVGSSERIALRGWYAGEDRDGNQALFYLPHGHADSVLTEWLEVLAEIAQRDDERAPIAAKSLETLLDPQTGPGACGKCHGGEIRVAVTEQRPIRWGYAGGKLRSHTRFAHSPHLNLLDGGSQCDTCHEMNPDAPYADYFTEPAGEVEFASNFRAIERATCGDCHQSGKVDADCQRCHSYHQGAGFKAGMIRRTASATHSEKD